MIALLIAVASAASMPNFAELENALGAGYYTLDAFNKAVAITGTAAQNFEPITPYCTSETACPDLTVLSWINGYPGGSPTTIPCQLATTTTEIAVVNLADFHLGSVVTDLPILSLQHVIDCEKGLTGTVPDDGTTVVTATQCLEAVNDPITTMQVLVSRPAYAQSVYPLSTTGAVTTCNTTSKSPVVSPLKLGLGIGIYKAATADAVIEHIKVYGPVIVKGSVGQIADLGTVSAPTFGPVGHYCGAVTPPKDVYLEVVGYEKRTVTGSTQICSTDTLVSGDMVTSYILRSPLHLNYNPAAAQPGYFYSTINATIAGAGTLTQVNVIPIANITAYFYYQPLAAAPPTDKPYEVSIDATGMYKYIDHNDTGLKNWHDDGTTEHWCVLEYDLLTNVTTHHAWFPRSDDATVRFAQALIDGLALSHAVNATKPTPNISYYGTLGVQGEVGTGNAGNYYDPATGTEVTARKFLFESITKYGLVSDQCYNDSLGFPVARPIAACTTTSATFETFGTGYRPVHVPKIDNAGLKKALVKFGVIVVSLKVNKAEFDAFLANATKTKDTVYLQTSMTNDYDLIGTFYGYGNLEGKQLYWNIRLPHSAFPSGNATSVEYRRPGIKIAMENTNSKCGESEVWAFATVGTDMPNPYVSDGPASAYTSIVSALLLLASILFTLL